jgi:putative nucleotidyltransferase with HDIG domain
VERARLTEALVPIGLAMGASLDLDGVLNVICRESLKLFEVDTSLVWFRERDELIGRAADGAKRADFIGMRQPLFNNSLLGARVVRERRAILANHAPKSDSVSSSIVERFQIQAVMGVPLFSEDEVVGALVLIETRNPERFGELDLEVARIFGQQTAMALTHARLYERIRQQADSLAMALEDLRATYRATLTTLSAALDARDHETEGHSQRVTAYALTLAGALGIQDAATLESLERGALLHDVGKIGVPDSILHKPTTLTALEWEAMRQHPEVGYTILRDVEFLQPALAVVLHHHERWDGTGYPFRLCGETIPLAARIFAVVDTLDAITSVRPYRPARSFAIAHAEILSQRGSQFDPAIVDAFAEMPESVWRAAAQQVQFQRASAPTLASFLGTSDSKALNAFAAAQQTVSRVHAR